jgi:hypothetical protein
MMITITTTGGIGGFGLAKSAEVEVGMLPEPLRLETCARLDPSVLGALDVPPRAAVADRIVYHIVVRAAGATRRFDLPESALPAATLELIDDLLQAEGRR